MRTSSKTSRRCFCAFCRSPRLVYRKRHVSAIDIGMSALAATLIGFVFWQTIDPRALVFFALAVGLAELFIVFRFRMSIVCRKCGFDPVLYKTSPEKASVRVQAHMKAWRENPASAFMAGPKLPVIRRKVDRKSTETLPQVPLAANSSASTAPLVARAGNR